LKTGEATWSQEKLKGDLAGLYSIRVNAQWRIVFAFENGQASGVRITEVRPYPHRLPPPTRPGEVLEEERLKPKGMSQTALAEKMGLHVQVVNGIVQGRRVVTAKTALLLAAALKTTPQFWLNLQNACDLWEAQKELGDKIKTASR
jgi:addiction module HigA family antidote